MKVSGKHAKELKVVLDVKARQVSLPDYMPEDVTLRQHKIKSEVRRGNVDHILPLIAEKAREAWKKLPKHVQVWLSLDDLIALGTGHASTVVLKAHRSSGTAGYVTYLYTSLENLYKDVLKAIYAEKRFVRGVYSMDTTTYVSKSGREFVLAEFMKLKADKYSANEEKLIRRIDAEHAFLRLYDKSSPKLRRYLIMWMLRTDKTKFKLYGDKYLSAKKEFKGLRPASLLGTEHCRCIWQDMVCRKNICHALCLRYRTPARKSSPPNPPLRDSLERLVASAALGLS